MAQTQTGSAATISLPEPQALDATVNRQRLVLIIIGVLLGMLLASLDQTIVGTALPRIVANLGGLEHYAWVVTAYLLASTASIPIYGKLSEGYQVSRVVKEIGSGVNDNRAQFLALLEDQRIHTIVVEHTARATRFGFRYLDTLLKGQGRTLEVVNLEENNREDLLTDLVSILYSFAARLYGQRRAKRKTEAIVKQLQEADE